MAYRQPGVTVTQDFVNALPALSVFSLPNVIVGPVFYVAQAAAAGTYAGALVSVGYAGQPAGSFIDTRAADPTDLVSYPVAINLGNCIVQILTSATGEVDGTNFNTFVDTTGSFAGVVPGDMIVIASGADAGTYTVRSVTDNNHVQVNETFASALTGISYIVQRNEGTVNIPTSTIGVVITSITVTVPAGLTATDVTFGVVPILTAQIQLNYRAQLITRSNDVYEYLNIEALEADFAANQIVPQNPAVFGAFLALNNSITPTNILGLDNNYLSNELLSYDNALIILSMNDVYAISVLTQSTAVHTALKVHVDAYSQPAEKLERVGIINRQLVTTATIDGPFSNGTTDATGLLLGSVGATFITDGVFAGDYVQITSPTLYAGKYLISAVNSQTQLQLATAPGISLSGLTFYTYEQLDTSHQAAVIAAYAQSFADSRMVLTWPDIVNIPVGNTIQQLPGYFLNCAVGALTTGLPTQQGFTNLSVAVYSGVVHSTKYFSNDDLNTMAAGGVMIFVQDILNQTPLFVRHQLTTNTSSVLFQEYSITKNVDFIAKFIRLNHLKFIGQYNIVEGTFDALKTNALTIINYLSEEVILPQIGGVLVSGELTSIVQNPDELDSIVETWTISVPVPLNYLDITLVIAS